MAGVDKFGHKLSDVSKAFAKKFSCGASVVKTPTGEEQIDIQGDVLNDIVDFLVEKFKVFKFEWIEVIDVEDLGGCHCGR